MSTQASVAVAPSHSTLREGVIAGALAATAVAVWFFIVDLIAGVPLRAPRLLGEALFSVLGPVGSSSPALYVVVYTIVHYVLFFIAGIIVTAVIHASEKQPTVLAGAFILFIVLELLFYGVVSLLANALLQSLAWYSVAIGNLLAAVVMGVYLWRRHPTLGAKLSYSLSGEERGRD